ncbi:MAG: isoprenylcysteine carboxylmethyltransferase family protein [Acidobacteriaceae bacterium]
MTLVVVLAVVVLFARFAWGQPWTAWHIAGLAIAVPSFGLFVAARITLGRSFSVQAKATALVTTGIYAWVRNPIYVFGALTFAGILIWMHRPWWLLILAVLVPMQVWRARKEERVLEEKFGSAYLEYKRKTWF